MCRCFCNYDRSILLLLSASILFISVIFYGQNLAGSSLRISAKCQSQKNVSLIYRSIFIAPVRLIIVTLSFAHQRDFLWPESRPIITQNFAQMSEPKKCLASFSLIYRSIFIAPVRLIIVRLSIAHQRDFLRLESCPYLAESFRTGITVLIRVKQKLP